MALVAGSVAQLGTVGFSKLLYVGVSCGFVEEQKLDIFITDNKSVCVGVREGKSASLKERKYHFPKEMKSELDRLYH